jgi:polar amino acid transport system substrate-binding protein
VTKDPASGEPRGVAIDLALELGRRIGRPVEFVGYANASRLTRAVESGEWDISFQAAEASRGAAITFTPGYVEIDATYLV